MAATAALQVVVPVGAALALSSLFVSAQTTQLPASAPAFEVASVRVNTNPDPAWKMQFTPDGLTARDVTLEDALRGAFGIYDGRLWSGGPAWISQKRFDIEAKFDIAQYPHPTLEQRRAMLQQLLADRFKLRVHRQQRQFPLYALVVANREPRFPETKSEDLRDSPAYGIMCRVLRSGKGAMQLSGCSTTDLASSLSEIAANDLGRKVVDHTALKGHYDFSLRWTPIESSSPTGGGSPSTIDLGGPSIFSALKEQLGLELKPIIGPLDTIVIDHVEMPSEN